MIFKLLPEENDGEKVKPGPTGWPIRRISPRKGRLNYFDESSIRETRSRLFYVRNSEGG